jgi:hypothetical protein
MSQQQPKLRAGSRRRLLHVLGRLEDWEPTTKTFTLVLDEDVSLPCVFLGADPTSAEALRGRQAFVAGTAVWNLKGELQRLDALGATDGEGCAPSWSLLPSAPSERSELPVEAPTPPLPELVFSEDVNDTLSDVEVLKQLKELG